MRVQKLYTTQHDYPIDNIFNIEQPETYECHIYEYKVGHPYLQIRAYEHERRSDEKPYEITFNSVRYFEGPMTWDNANFIIAAPQGCVEIVRKVKYEQGLSDAGILENFLLFQLQTPTFLVKIVAMSAYLRLMTRKEFIRKEINS